MRDVELLRWTTSSGKRLRLGSGEVADGGGWGFAAGAERLWRPEISNGGKEADVGLGKEMEKGEVIDEPFGGKGVIGEIGLEFRREPQFLKDPGV